MTKGIWARLRDRVRQASLTALGGMAAAAALTAVPAAAQQVAHPPSPPPSAPALTHDDLEAWLDGYLPYVMRRDDVAGAVVVVVKDGKVLLEKGYGYADVASHRPVDPETTLFRPGSVSKLITWTAVMQQVEQGRIDLDADINRYLDFNIAPYQGRPITMRDLMTHTPGFQDAYRNLVLPGEQKPTPLGEHLKRNLPDRIYPPGQVPAYSNYGVALAGYIVQRVSGEAFENYIDREIFAPLGMKNATFRQPLPARLRGQLASPYRLASEPAKPFEMFNIVPAGSASVSGADMGRFMIAHLQDGAFEGQRILQPATARMMHDTRSPAGPPGLNHMRLGFDGLDQNGRRIIGHGGDTIWFHSHLQLFPDDHVGLFVSFNSIGKNGGSRAIRAGLLEEFTERYFPGPPARGQVPPERAKADAALIAGTYNSAQWEPNTFLSLLSLFTQATVTTDGQGHISTSASLRPDGLPKVYEEIAPFVWREMGGKEMLSAKVEGGKVVMWGTDDWPAEVHLPTPLWRNAGWLAPMMALSIGALLITVTLWPVGVLLRRRYGAPFALRGGAAWSHRLVRIGGGTAALLTVAWAAMVIHMMTTFSISAALTPWILTLHLLSIVAFPLAAAAALWNAWTIWTTRRGLSNAFAWAWSGVLAISSLTLLWAAIIFHLIGLGLKF